jgi:hypothetical protein
MGFCPLAFAVTFVHSAQRPLEPFERAVIGFRELAAFVHSALEPLPLSSVSEPLILVALGIAMFVLSDIIPTRSRTAAVDRGTNLEVLKLRPNVTSKARNRAVNVLPEKATGRASAHEPSVPRIVQFPIQVQTRIRNTDSKANDV